MTQFTQGLKSAATLFWCAGFFTAPFDSLNLEFFDWKIPLCFGLFFCATILCLWSEKREFSTRFAAYRVYDIAINTSWKYLLIYFLWVSIFARFTEFPLKSIVYALGGWGAYFTIGVSAQLLFCERKEELYLIRERLKILYISFCAAIFVGMLSLGIDWGMGLNVSLVGDLANFLFFAALGMPALLWDLFLHRQKFVSHRFNFLILFFVFLGLVLTKRYVFLSSLAIICLSFGWIRLTIKPNFFRALALLLSVGFVAVLAGYSIFSNFDYFHDLLRERLEVSIYDAFQVAASYRYLGEGIGISENRNGIWAQILAEHGIVGILLYGSFVLSLARALWLQKSIPSRIGLVSLLSFIVLISHYYKNAYAPAIWAWYATWSLLGSTGLKKDIVI